MAFLIRHGKKQYENGDDYEYCLDPGLTESLSDDAVLLNMFDTLYSYNEKGEVVPSLAQVCTPDSTQTIFTCSLRQDAKFSDGTSITAQTVKDSWMRVLNAQTGSTYAYIIGDFIKNGDAQYL